MSNDDERSSDGGGAAPGLEELRRRNFRGELHLPLEPGTVIDERWQLRRLLGVGGFGRVYEAWHLELDRPAAIKVLDARHGGPEARQRFRDEARLMAGLSSEHLVRASDYGELPDGSPYFVMDLAEGKTLRALLGKGLSMSRALGLAEGILQGLALVHARGVIHGDIKPENIIVDEMDGKARLLDFGLAQTWAIEGEDVGGTAQYMAPEMLLDHAQASVRTEVYAVGTVLYEMLTGRLPRGHGEMTPDLVVKAWGKKPKPDPVRMYCSVREGLGEPMEQLEELVARALAQDPSRRFQSTDQMLAELRRLIPLLSPDGLASTLEPRARGARPLGETRTTNRIPGEEPAPIGSGSRWAVVAVVAALIGFGIWAALSGSRGAGEQTTEPETPAAPDFARVAGGIVVAVADGAGDDAQRTHRMVCDALTGERVIGVSVSCTTIPAVFVDSVVGLADEVGVKAVVLVGAGSGNEAVVHLTSHHGGNPILASIDGLRLPNDSASMAAVAPVLLALVGVVSVVDVEIDSLEPEQVGARWAALAEWFRVQQGHRALEDGQRRAKLQRALDRGLNQARGTQERRQAMFYRDLGVLLMGAELCAVAEPMLRELVQRDQRQDHQRAVRVSALLGLVDCLLERDDALDHVREAQAHLADAFESSAGDVCVRVGAIGSMSLIDALNGNDALWEANEPRLPSTTKCDAATWSQVFGVRGDALLSRERWCDAADTYARAYAISRSEISMLLNWAEYNWFCEPGLEVPRDELTDELRLASSSEQFGSASEQVSIAYMRWWLGRKTADAESVVARYAAVPDGQVPLLEGVASDLETEICEGFEAGACSLQILTRHKASADTERLRMSLGLR